MSKEVVKMSTGQRQYLKNLRRSRQLVQLTRIAIFVIFVALWEISTHFKWIDSFVFSSPSRVVNTMITMAQNHSLFIHIGVTLWETLASFFFVTVFGVGIAVLLWASPKVSAIIEPYLVVLNSLPKSALAPLLIVWLGANTTTIIVAGMSVAIFGAIINLYIGFQEVDPDKIKLIYTLGGKKKDTLSKVVLPASVPVILGVMKVNIGLCLVGVVIGEFIGSKEGLGYLIIYGSQVFKLDWVIMSIVILCVMAMILYSLINLAEKMYMKRL